MVNDVKELRVEAARVINTIKKLKGSRYLSLAITNAEEGRMMLGDVLASLGELSSVLSAGWQGMEGMEDKGEDLYHTVNRSAPV